jgi:diguanylate cyclase (GGDEF)-like protein/PAS domain S-box-containing protein
MKFLDTRTIYFLNFIINVINTVTMLFYWRLYRRRFPGMSYWLAAMLAETAGIVLFMVHGSTPGPLTSIVANTLLLSGSLFLLAGLGRFVRSWKVQSYNYCLLALNALILYFFSVIKPDITARKIAVSAMIIVFNGEICWLLFRRTALGLRKITTTTGIVVGGYALASLIRIILLLQYPLVATDSLQSVAIDSITIITYLSLHVCLLIALISMVTKRLLLEVAVQEEKFTKAFHLAPYAILLTRQADGEIFEVNDGFVTITGYQREEAIGKKTTDLQLWAAEGERPNLSNHLLDGDVIRGLEIKVRKKGGKVLTGLYSAESIKINNEECRISSITDITEQIAIRMQLKEMATHDALTGLPNRRLFYDRFQIAQANAERTRKSMAIMSLDLDKFKQVNDKYGHAHGDKVLVEASTRLTRSLRKGDTIARFGGDEFVMLLGSIETRADASAIAQKILEEFRQPFQIESHTIQFSSSIGIALYPGDGESIEDLIRKSDESLYAVKSDGRNDFKYFDHI